MLSSTQAKNILVTGGAGFIGSAVIRYMLDQTSANIVNLDALTYAADLTSLSAHSLNPRYNFERANICDRENVALLLKKYQPDAVMHLAAESHVDRSIEEGGTFVKTNIVGTYSLLEEVRIYWEQLPETEKKKFRFLHVSTDEVYGSLGPVGRFTEDSPYHPNSPYSASKAASDHLARAWHQTYGLPVLISNCSNNYGPYQFPEKLIPLMIINALLSKPLPVYGTGENVRDWLFVDDHARALATILLSGNVGETYNIGGDEECRNIDLISELCSLLDELAPNTNGAPHSELVTYVQDRPGHDLRYAMDATKIQTTLGWVPHETLASGLRKTVSWYLNNRSWWDSISKLGLNEARLGLRAAKSGDINTDAI